MEDILKEKDKLLEEAGLNSYYTYYYKRVDKGLNGGQKQSNIYDRVGYEEAEASLTDPVVSTCFYLSILPILQKDIIFKPIIEGKKSDIKKIESKFKSWINKKTYSFKIPNNCNNTLVATYLDIETNKKKHYVKLKFTI